MAETSWPGAGGKSVVEHRYEHLIGNITSDGVIGAPGDAPIVYGDATGRHVKVRANRLAVVRGFMYWSGTTTIELPVAANTTGKTRIDKVVLRLDRADWSVSAVVIRGTAATNPVAPAHIQQPPPTGFWDVPVANVTVSSGATGISASNVSDLGYYIGDGPLAGPGSAVPSPMGGRIYYNTTSRRTHIGTGTEWKLLAYDSGWLSLPAPSGFSGSIKYRSRQGWVIVQYSLERTITALGKKTDKVLGTLPAGFRPSAQVVGAAIITDPDHSTYWHTDTTGKITLRSDNTHLIDKKSLVYGSMSFPIDG